MKIAIASDGKGEESAVSEQAGRAPYFQIAEAGKIVEVLSNPFALGGGGAGLAVARMMHQKGVGEIIAGQIGPNMQDALDELGVRFRKAQGKVRDSL